MSAADVDRALTEQRALVIGWLNRGTLQLVPSEDYHWLHALTAPRLVKGNARRLAQEGVSDSAADRDLAKWSGLPLGHARAGLERIAGELAPLDDGLVDLARREPPAEGLPSPRLLGPYEPVLLGWASRSDVLGEHQAA